MSSQFSRVQSWAGQAQCHGHFPTDDAAIKLIGLAIADIVDKRARQRAAEAGKPANTRIAPGRLVEGAGIHGWKQAFTPNADACEGCGLCVAACPEHAIVLRRKTT